MALDHFTFIRPTTTDVLDASGDTVTVDANVPAFEFNADGTYKGLKWTSDSEATLDPATDQIGQNEGRIVIEVDSANEFKIEIVDVSAEVDSGVSKIEFRYTPTSQKLFVNDTEVDSATGLFDFSDLDKFELGHDDGADQPIGVHYRLLAIYKTAN